MKAGEILTHTQPLIQSSNMYDENLSFLSGLRRSCVALTKVFLLTPRLRMC